jgi:hypothetical protein
MIDLDRILLIDLECHKLTPSHLRRATPLWFAERGHAVG